MMVQSVMVAVDDPEPWSRITTSAPEYTAEMVNKVKMISLWDLFIAGSLSGCGWLEEKSSCRNYTSHRYVENFAIEDRPKKGVKMRCEMFKLIPDDSPI